MADYEAEHETAKKYGNRWREVFGFNPTSGTCRTYVASMLALLGFKLNRTSQRARIGERRFWHYEVLDELAAIDRQQVMATMRQALQ